MKIGIDISQTAYEGTGVAVFVENLVRSLIENDTGNEYILFFSSLRKKPYISTIMQGSGRDLKANNIKFKILPIPPLLLDFLWNRLHILPIEWFIGNIDVFISSDWTQPPVNKARSLTILYDLVVYKYPHETADKIINIQKRRLKHVVKECDMVICISEATKKDAREILGIEENRLQVVYPGI